MEASADEVKFSALMPEKLDIKTAKPEAFRSWHLQWKEFYQLTGLDEQDIDFQLNSLRSFLTESSLDFVDTVLLTADSESDIIESIISEIKNYICGQSSIVHVRRSFNLRQQDEDEMFDAFLRDLIGLAKACDFCTSCEDSLVRDRIIIGLKDPETIDKLLDEADLTLQLAIDICRAEETSKIYQNNFNKRSSDGYKEDDADAFSDFDYKPNQDDLLAASEAYGTRKRKRTKGPAKKVKVTTKRKRRKVVKEIEDDDDMDNDAGDIVQDDGDIPQDEGDVAQEVDEGGPYNCDKCKYVGRIKMHLLRHQKNQHDENKPFPCTKCDRSFGMKIHLTRHVETVHEKLKPFDCPRCPSSFGKRSTLTCHIRTVHDKIRLFACDRCESRFNQRPHLNHHIRIVHENNRRFKCDHCDKRCATRKDLEKHVDNNHKEKKCNFCNMQFEKRSDLRYHQLTEHQFIKPHLCESCGKGYTTQCALNGHMTRVHGKPEVHCECKICLAKATRAALQLVDEEGAEEPGLIHDDDLPKVRRPHLCELCGKSYSALPGLRYHMQTVHGHCDQSCKCESCQADNTSQEQAVMDKNFKQPHKHRPFKCMLCTSSFTQVNSLTEHIATVHSRVKRFSCDICKGAFTSHKHLAVHVRSIHLGIKPFDCPHCTAKFTQLGHRNRHVRVVHDGIKKFSCDMCDKKYASKIDLKLHLKKIHGKVFMFECTLCDSKFEQRKFLMLHITEAHQSVEQNESVVAEAKWFKETT